MVLSIFSLSLEVNFPCFLLQPLQHKYYLARVPTYFRCLSQLSFEHLQAVKFPNADALKHLHLAMKRSQSVELQSTLPKHQDGFSVISCILSFPLFCTFNLKFWRYKSQKHLMVIIISFFFCFIDHITI